MTANVPPACGVIYVATGDKYRAEVARSLASLREQHPAMPVTVMTDRTLGVDGVDEVLIREPSFNFLDKVANLVRSPYKRTLFLDTDTMVCGSIIGLFDVLDRFEFGGVHSPGRECVGSCYQINGVPESFVQFNSGVLVFRKCEAVDEMLGRWLQLYRRDLDVYLALSPDAQAGMKFPQDQPSLREAMYFSCVNLVTLPSEYNFRTIFPGYAGQQIRVLHGRGHSLRALCESLNAVRGKRVYVPAVGVITVSGQH